MWSLNLVEDWKLVVKHAWSFRLLGLAIVLDCVAVGLHYLAPYGAWALLADLAGTGCTGFAMIARLIGQKEFNDGH